MNNVLFKGVFSATFSIYDKDMRVKRDSVEKLIKYNSENGIKGFYVGGNTGECNVLPKKTRMEMLETVKAVAPENSQIIAHIGAGIFEDTKELIAHANKIGVDAMSSLPPSLSSYYKPDEAIEYYKQIAALCEKPLLAYVTPAALSCNPVWFSEEIMKIDNIIGLKCTIPNYYYFERIKRINGGNINLLNGPDECMLAGLIMGADGAIGTNYNLLPKVACGIYDSFAKGDMKAALEYQSKLNNNVDMLIGNGVVHWKQALRLLDIDPGYTVAPAHVHTESELNELLDKLKASGFLDMI